MATNSLRCMSNEGGSVHPEGDSQQDQLEGLRSEGDHPDVYFDTSEVEERRVLGSLFGDHDGRGIYHASDEQQVDHEGGEES
jgi:hypothetical protein